MNPLEPTQVLSKYHATYFARYGTIPRRDGLEWQHIWGLLLLESRMIRQILGT